MKEWEYLQDACVVFLLTIVSSRRRLFRIARRYEAGPPIRIWQSVDLPGPSSWPKVCEECLDEQCVDLFPCSPVPRFLVSNPFLHIGAATSTRPRFRSSSSPPTTLTRTATANAVRLVPPRPTLSAELIFPHCRLLSREGARSAIPLQQDVRLAQLVSYQGEAGHDVPQATQVHQHREGRPGQGYQAPGSSSLSFLVSYLHVNASPRCRSSTRRRSPSSLSASSITSKSCRTRLSPSPTSSSRAVTPSRSSVSTRTTSI